MEEAFKYSLKVIEYLPHLIFLRKQAVRQIEQWIEYILQACELGSMAGCVNVSTWNKFVPNNRIHKTDFWILTLDLKVSMMYAKGEGTDKNPVAAKE